MMQNKQKQNVFLKETSRYIRQNVCSTRVIWILLLILLFATILLAMAIPAEAAGNATKLIIFTDKKIYHDFWFANGRSVSTPEYRETDGDELEVYVFAILLDEDGNMVTGETSNLSGNLEDTKRFDHYDKGTDTYHHAVTLNPTFYEAASNSLTFTDDGTSGDDVSGDGLYTAYLNVDEMDGAALIEDHLLINVTVEYSGTSSITEYYEILFTGWACHNGETEAHGTHTSNKGEDGGYDACAICHHGNEHLFESVSGDNATFSELSSHYYNITPTDTSQGAQPITTYRWNMSWLDGSTTASDLTWSNFVPGSEYCQACHFTTGGTGTGTIYDYDDGDRSASTDNRPSCNVASKLLDGNSITTVTCHTSTTIESTSLSGLEWDWATSGSKTGANNHSHAGSSTNVTCEFCHTNFHASTLPNPTTRTSINDQCTSCHSPTGPSGFVDFTHSESTTDCKACHLDDNQKLDSHLVPAAGIPNANCSECHDMGGKAPYHVDYNTMNKSDYVHYNLNSNATITGASNGEEDRMCWACHGEDDDSDGKADFSEQPNSSHSSNYNIANAHNCTYCHNNTNSNTSFGAPQNKAHTWYDDEINTPAVTGCEDCHAEAEMYNTSHVDDDHVTRIGLSVHYGTGHAYLENAQHTSAYCKYCHMNTSTTFSDAFSNPENMQRSEHSNNVTTPDCTVAECHNAYELHGTGMTEPTYTDASCVSNETACHSSSEYSNHNGNVTCLECHMNNNQTNIHPIKYLQLDGVTFSSSSVTAAPCVTCHQSTAADAIMAEWGHTPGKVEHQHHSEDSANGSKWRRGEVAYWDYVPRVFTFPTSWIRNEMNDSTNTNSTIINFASMTATNESATRIQETSGGAFVGDLPDNHDFPNLQNWNSSGVETGVTMGWDGAEGNPAGSVYVQATGRNVAATAYWNGSFYYSNSKTIAYASIQLDSRMLTLQGAGATGDFTVYIDNGTALTEVYSRTYTVTETEWVEMEPVEIIGASQLFNVDSDYEVVIESNLLCANLKTTEVKVGYDNVHVVIKEEDFQLYNYTFNIDNVPNGVAYDYELFVGYQAHTEPASLYIYNNSTSNFEYRASLDQGAFTKVKLNMSLDEYNSGDVKVRINDTDIGVDTDSDYFDIQYMFVHGYKDTNYPCEYCHSPNKHSVNALGIPAEFAGLNTENQSINSTTNWCASCHYEGYVSNGGDYSDVISAFTNHSLPIPPEITGNATYGNMSNSTDGSQVYVDHSDYGMSDEDCFSCHKGGLEEGTLSTEFMHNVSTGTSGNRNCTECHTPIATSYAQIDYNAVASGMHATLKNDTANPDNTTNPTNPIELICWACHGDGLYLDPGDHYTKPAKVCEDCHITGKTDYLATNVSDHIWTGEYGSTDVLITASSTVSDCAGCHNNSINASFVDNTPDTDTASASHYGVNKTADLLMSAGSSSTDCLYCHRNTDKGIEADWGVNSSTTTDLDTKGEPHTSYLLANCYDCHGGTPTDFHEDVMDPGAGAGPNCIGCHDIEGSQQNVNFTAMNQSDAAHKYLNNNTGTGLNIVNEKCWACHNNGLQPANGTHGIGNYKDPYLCVDCHTSTGSQAGVYPTAWNVTEHVSNADELHTNQSFANVNDSCRSCHEDIAEMMISPSIVNDLDGASSNVYSGTHGGNESSSHYALKRSLGTGDAYCNYCHANASSSFQYNNSNNKLIYEHTANGSADVNNSTTLNCVDCHLTGRIHNSSLTTPPAYDWNAAGGEDKCAPCHLSGDSGSNMSVSNSMHNTSANIADCGVCHNSDAFATGGAYLSVHSANLTAAPPAVADTCTECHTNATWVSMVIYTHFPGAEAGKGNTSESNRSCEGCHALSVDDSMHASGMVSKPTDGCDECHNSLSSPYSATNRTLNAYLHDNPDITGMVDVDGCEYCHNNSNQTEQFHFTQWAEGTVAAPGWGGWIDGTSVNCTSCHYDYNDTAPFNAMGVSAGHVENIVSLTWGIDACYDCHTDVATQSDDPVAMHSVEAAPADANCTKCHDLGKEATNVDVSAMNTSQSMHKDLNAGADATGVDPQYATESKRCWACHGNGTAPTTHPTNYRIPLKCEDCHTTNGTNYSDYTPVVVVDHIPAGMNNSTNVKKDMPYCSVCHNNSVATGIDSSVIRNINDTTAHYGLNDTGSKLMTATNDSLDCKYCHMDNTNNVTWGNATYFTEHQGTTTSSPNSECYGCHNESDSVPLTNLHAIELSPGVGAGPDCISCHDAPSGPKSYSLIDFSVSNASDAIHKMVNADVVSSYDSANYPCWGCHGNGSQPATGTHPTEYKTPSICQDCHVPGGSRYTWATTLVTPPAPSVQEHYTGANLSAASSANVTWSCLQCHQDSSGMILTNADTDTAMKSNWTDDGYDGNGGSNSSYHYGKKRTDMGSDDDYCNYCHNNANASNSFPYDDAHNKAITEHTANTSADINDSMTCGLCHGNGSIHDVALETPPAFGWSGASNSVCAPCHESSGSGSVMKVASHNTTTAGIDDCAECHNDVTYGTSGAYQNIHSDNLTAGASASYDSCTECHITDTTFVTNAVNTHYKGAVAGKGNTASYECEDCHNLGVGASMHTSGMNIPSEGCNECHNDTGSTIYDSTILIQNLNHDNATFGGAVTCDTCHDTGDEPANFHFSNYPNGTVENTTWKTPGVLVNCIDCHTDHNETSSPYYAEPTSYHKGTYGSAIDECYDCHTTVATATDANAAEAMHNVTITGVWDDCISCHESETNGAPEIDTTQVSAGIHQNLNSGGNGACTACHGSAADHYTTARNCDFCHMNGSDTYSSRQVAEHYPSASELSTYSSQADNDACIDCHNKTEMMLTYTDGTPGTNPAQVAHYGANRTDMGTNDSYCNYCHNNASTVFTFENANNKAIMEHTTNGSADVTNVSMECESCHVNGRIHEDVLTTPTVTEWTNTQGDYCAPCHEPGYSNATMFVYDQAHNPTNAAPGNITGCGYCHNATSQSPASFRIHDADMQATVPGNSTCVGCHNATTAYVGADDQILSHMPNGGQYIGNTSVSGYDNCEDCHNISVGASMHSSGLNNPVITDCTDCHINGSLSPFNSTTKVVVMSDYNHTYSNETPSCNISLCHNASGNSSFHMDAYAAADIGDPGTGWETRGDEGFSGPLVDCIDCHETHNGTDPFNAPWVEAGLTGADLEDHTSKTYAIESCYVCHTNRTDASDRYMVHNVTIEPLSGGPDCLNCHNTSSNEGATTSKLLDEANLTGTAHEMLNRANGSVTQDATCWACHGTGAEPGKHPENYKNPYTCEDCHTPTGSITDDYANSTDIYKHYMGAVWKYSKKLMTVECSVCHDNSDFVTYLSPNNMSITYNAVHYGTNYSAPISSCDDACHDDGTLNETYGNATLNQKFGAFNSVTGTCYYCHNETRNSIDAGIRGTTWAEPTLHQQSVDSYTSGRCYEAEIYGGGCHPVPVVVRPRRR